MLSTLMDALMDPIIILVRGIDIEALKIYAKDGLILT